MVDNGKIRLPKKIHSLLAPALFSMVFAAMFHDDSQDNDDGIQLKYRTDG